MNLIDRLTAVWIVTVITIQVLPEPHKWPLPIKFVVIAYITLLTGALIWLVLRKTGRRSP